LSSFKVKLNGGASNEQNSRRSEMNASNLMMMNRQLVVALVAVASALCWQSAAQGEVSRAAPGQKINCPAENAKVQGFA
jgi:hypothetical protein